MDKLMKNRRDRLFEILKHVRESRPDEQSPDELSDPVLVALFEHEHGEVDHSKISEEGGFDLEKSAYYCIERKTGQRLFIMDMGTGDPDDVAIALVSDQFQSCDEFLDAYGEFAKTHASDIKKSMGIG